MKVRDILKLLREDGWFLVNEEGSHKQFKHPIKKGRVTVVRDGNDDIDPGTLNSILKQSGLKGRRNKDGKGILGRHRKKQK